MPLKPPRLLLFGTLLLAALPAAAGEAAAIGSMKTVERFLKTPTAELPPEEVPAFLAVDPGSLPAKLRPAYAAKRQELLALKKLVDGGRKPPIRRLDMPSPSERDCRPLEGAGISDKLRAVGFMDLTEEEVRFLSGKTNCSECEMMTEFTLTKVLEPAKTRAGAKKPPLEMVFLLHSKDPLSALVGGRREGVKNPFGTNFFGMGFPSCH